MRAHAVTLAFAFVLTTQSSAEAADIGQSPEENVQICGSEECIRAAWDYFEWCWFGSGLPRTLQMSADGLPSENTYQPSDYWNKPADPPLIPGKDPKLRGFDWLSSTSLSNNSSSFSGFTPQYTAQLGNGLTMSVPATQSGAPRYDTGYVKICSIYGAGFFYIPGSDTCIKFHSGTTYDQKALEQQSPVNLNYTYGDGGGEGGMPIEYVRICSIYGAGFYYIPGTDSCLKIGGELRHERSPFPDRITTRTETDWKVSGGLKYSFDKTLVDREVDTKVDEPKLPNREVFKKDSPTATSKEKKSAAKKGGEAKQAKNEPKQPPAAAQQVQLSEKPRWIDAKTGLPVPVGPEGTRPGLFDDNEAHNVETGKSYKKENGVWKDTTTGKEVPELPIYAKTDPADPNIATHRYNGRKFRFDGAKQAAGQPAAGQQAAGAGAAAANIPDKNGRWVDAKTGKPVQVGPEGTRPGLFDPNEAFNPNTGKSYKKENGIWKDTSTGKEAPEIPINSKQDPGDPNKAKHGYNDSTFINVSPKTQAEERADRIKNKLAEAKARLKELEGKDKSETYMERSRTEFEIETLEKGLDPDEEAAKFAAQGQHVKAQVKEMQETQELLDGSYKRAEQKYDEERKKLQDMKDNVSSWEKDTPQYKEKFAKEQAAFDQAKQDMQTAKKIRDEGEKKLTTAQKELERKYGLTLEAQPLTEEQQKQLQETLKEFFDKGQQPAKSAEGQRPANKGPAQSKGTKGPPKNAGAVQKAADAPAAGAGAAASTSIKINIEAKGWATASSVSLPSDFMMKFETSYTPALELDIKYDVGYDRPASMAVVRNGAGTFEMPYELRQDFGLSWARPGASYKLGVELPRLSEYVMKTTVDSSGIPTELPAEKLPAGIKMFRDVYDVDGTRYSRIGIQERFEATKTWASGPTLAKLFGVEPAEVSEDWCWQKLPAYELDPATSTAAGHELPSATLALESKGSNGGVFP